MKTYKYYPRKAYCPACQEVWDHFKEKYDKHARAIPLELDEARCGRCGFIHEREEE